MGPTSLLHSPFHVCDIFKVLFNDLNYMFLVFLHPICLGATDLFLNVVSKPEEGKLRLVTAELSANCLVSGC